MGDNKICPYCNESFKSGQTLTSNEAKNIVHLACERNIEYQVYLAHITKKQIVKKIKTIVNDPYDCDYEMLAKIRILFGEKNLSDHERMLKEVSTPFKLFGDLE